LRKDAEPEGKANGCKRHGQEIVHVVMGMGNGENVRGESPPPSTSFYFLKLL